MARYRLSLFDPRGLRVLAAAWLVGISASGFSQAADGKPPFTISKETTYLTEPLRKDGYVDYVAVLNKRSSEGVTPENNAAVLFWRAVGPAKIDPEFRGEFFNMLGIPPLPETGDYFVRLSDIMPRWTAGGEPGDTDARTAAQHDVARQVVQTRHRPWSPREFPALAEWLAANDAPLALVVEASRRPRCYDPLCCREGTRLFAVRWHTAPRYFMIAQVLCSRAMLRLDEDRVDDAWQDLLSVHRLARLVGQGPWVLDVRIAIDVEDMAFAAGQSLLAHARLAPGQLARIREDLDRLPVMPAMADKIDFAERLAYLDNVFVSFREKTLPLHGLEDMMVSKEIAPLIDSGVEKEVDWDVALRLGNWWYDRVADAYRKSTRALRREALRRLDDDFRSLGHTQEDAKLIATNPRRVLSERVGKILLDEGMAWFGGDHQSNLNAEDRQAMRSELNQLAFALAAYRAERGGYPGKLADLVPKYVAEVPKDLFTDAELQYRLEGDGFVLYSVGVNGKDDGAKSYKDGPKEQGWHDLVFRVRAAEPK